MRKKLGMRAFGIVLLTLVFNSCSSSNNGTPSGTGFMWVATAGDQTVSSYTINLSNGSVSSASSSVSSGPNPSAMALTPDGTAMFVADSDGIHTFTVASDGTLTASSAAPVPIAPL